MGHLSRPIKAVRGDPKLHKRKCFWYRRDQVEVLFQDYFRVAERTGFAPRKWISINMLHPMHPTNYQLM